MPAGPRGPKWVPQTLRRIFGAAGLRRRNAWFYVLWAGLDATGGLVGSHGGPRRSMGTPGVPAGPARIQVDPPNAEEDIWRSWVATPQCLVLRALGRLGRHRRSCGITWGTAKVHGGSRGASRAARTQVGPPDAEEDIWRSWVATPKCLVLRALGRLGCHRGSCGITLGTAKVHGGSRGASRAARTQVGPPDAEEDIWRSWVATPKCLVLRTLGRLGRHRRSCGITWGTAKVHGGSRGASRARPDLSGSPTR